MRRLAARILRVLVLSAIAQALLVLAPRPLNASDARDAATLKWNPWIEMGGYLGSDDASRGELTFFAPLMQGLTSLFFADLRGKLFEQEVSEGNFSLGLRSMKTSGWNLGIWSGLDVRETSSGNTFWQVSGGLEALHPVWDLRTNTYLPLSDPKQSPQIAEVSLAGNQIYMVGGEEVPLFGIDAEAGMRIPLGWLTRAEMSRMGRKFGLRLYGGGFYFDHRDALEEVAGAKVRAELRFDDVFGSIPGSRLTFEGEFSHDQVRDDKWEFGARLRLPLGSSQANLTSDYAMLNPQERRMTEGLERDTDIVTGASKREPVQDALTNVPFERVAQLDTSNDIQAAIDAAGANSLIVARKGTGTFSQAALQANQTLQGGSSTIQVRGRESGTVANFKAPGTRPSIQHVQDAPVLTLSSNTHVAGLNVRGAGMASGLSSNHGILAPDNTGNIVLEQTAVWDTGGSGIRFSNTATVTGGNHSNVKIKDTTVFNTGNIAIAFLDNTTGISILNTSISNSNTGGIAFQNNNRDVVIADVSVDQTDNGIAFFDGNSDVRISNAKVTNAANTAIAILTNNSNVTVSDTTIEDAANVGIYLADANTNVTFKNTGFARVNNIGIFVEENNSAVSIRDVEIVDTGNAAIVLGDANTDVTIQHAAITNSTAFGLLLQSNNADVTISKTNITDSAIGIAIVSNNSNIDLEQLEIRDMALDGISFGNDNSAAIEDNTFAGPYGRDIVNMLGPNNTLNGSGNALAPGTTVAGDVCRGQGNFTGSVEINGTTYTGGQPPCAP